MEADREIIRQFGVVLSDGVLAGIEEHYLYICSIQKYVTINVMYFTVEISVGSTVLRLSYSRSQKYLRILKRYNTFR